MFGHAYFGAVYFAPPYFGPATGGAPPAPPPVLDGGRSIAARLDLEEYLTTGRLTKPVPKAEARVIASVAVNSIADGDSMEIVSDKLRQALADERLPWRDEYVFTVQELLPVASHIVNPPDDIDLEMVAAAIILLN